MRFFRPSLLLVLISAYWLVVLWRLKLCLPPETGKELFSQIQKQESFAYSFLFNATFNAINSLESYEDAMVARGNIIDIEEVFYTERNNGQQEQMLMHVKLLLNSITFVGKQHNLELSIN